MASISTREKGYLIQFTLDSKRKTISFSKKYKQKLLISTIKQGVTANAITP